MISSVFMRTVARPRSRKRTGRAPRRPLARPQDDLAVRAVLEHHRAARLQPKIVADAFGTVTWPLLVTFVLIGQYLTNARYYCSRYLQERHSAPCGIDRSPRMRRATGRSHRHWQHLRDVNVMFELAQRRGRSHLPFQEPTATARAISSQERRIIVDRRRSFVRHSLASRARGNVEIAICTVRNLTWGSTEPLCLTPQRVSVSSIRRTRCSTWCP